MHRRGLVALAVLLAPAVAHADLQSGSDKLTKGDYKGALADLTKVGGKDRAAANRLVFEAQLVTGDYPAALTTATTLAGDKDAKVAVHGKVDQARVHLATGKLDDAKQDVAGILKTNPTNLPARWAMATVLQTSGHRTDATVLWQSIFDDYDANKIDTDDAEQLFYLAEAAKNIAQYKFANDSYREAVNLAPEEYRYAIAWAHLFLQKYNAGDADTTLEDVFKTNPNDPAAHAAMAATIVDESYDLASVDHHLDQAFALDPHCPEALRVRASIEIDRNQWDAAKKDLADALGVNPADVEAMSMLATIAWLRDDLPEYETQKKAVFAVDPEFAEIYRIVAKSAVREHRYKEAINLEKEALELRPDYFEAMAGVGEGYLRLGEEKEGLDWLHKSWDGDGYNVRTFNTLNLFDDTIPKEYTFHSTKNFRVRYHKDEEALLSRYIEPMLEEEYATLSKKYGFKPKTPITVELYTDATDYSVRTVGLPNLGALGVCFGQVITAMSPSNGDINWGMVLWHETAHVFAIQLSNSRVPRWFTEGLSEYETLVRRPDWRRENDADLYGAIQEGHLPSIGELNYQFMSPDQNAVVVAYYQAAVTIEWLADTYGFDKIVAALKLYGQGKESPEVLQTITGKSIAELDTAFHAYLDVRLAPYKGTFHLPSQGYDDVTALEIARDAAPKDATKWAAVALGYYYAGDGDNAAQNGAQALALDPSNPIARYVVAEVDLRTGDEKSALTAYQGMVAEGIDSYDIRTRLAQIAKDGGDRAGEEKQMCAAKTLDPERSYPYQALSDDYAADGHKDQSLVELTHYAYIEQMELAPPKTLVAEYAKLAQWAKVRTYGEIVTFIDPFDADSLMTLGQAYLELKDAKKSLFSYDSALLGQPPMRRPALAQIGRARAYLAMGDKKNARAAVAAALKTEPENADALALKAQVK